MMDCKHATQLMSAELDRALGVGERIGLEVHLTICRGCDNYREQIRLLRKACQVYRHDLEEAPDDDLPPPATPSEK